MASVWVYMRSGQPTWARPRHPLPNIQIFGYERGIHLIKGKSQRNWSKTQSTHGQMDWDLICSNFSPEYVGPINKNPVSKSMNNVRNRKTGRVIATKGVKGGVEPNWCWFPTWPGKDVLARWQQRCVLDLKADKYVCLNSFLCTTLLLAGVMSNLKMIGKTWFLGWRYAVADSLRWCYAALIYFL